MRDRRQDEARAHRRSRPERATAMNWRRQADIQPRPESVPRKLSGYLENERASTGGLTLCTGHSRFKMIAIAAIIFVLIAPRWGAGASSEALFLEVLVQRFALFIDAGYLYAEGGKLCCGSPSRRRFTVNERELNLMLTKQMGERCGLSLLRTYWYDAARYGLRTVSQQAIAGLPNVKLRLGRLNALGQQKGVDALLYRDL